VTAEHTLTRQLITTETDQIDAALAIIEAKLDDLSMDIAAVESKLDALPGHITSEHNQTRDLISAEHDATRAHVTAEHDQTRAHVTTEHNQTRSEMHAEFDQVDAALAAIEVKLDDLATQIDEILEALEILEAKIDRFEQEFLDFVEFWTRMQIEQALTDCDTSCKRDYAEPKTPKSVKTPATPKAPKTPKAPASPKTLKCKDSIKGPSRTSIMYTPMSINPLGLLEKVRDVVADVLAENALMGYTDACADVDFQDGLVRMSMGDYKGAYDSFCRAYSRIVGGCPGEGSGK
jgi:prefoldin subunit 5